MKQLSYVFVIFAAVCWGLIGIFTKNLTALGYTEMEMIFIKIVIGAIVMLPLMIKDKNMFRLHSIFDLKYFIGTGICSYVFFNWCYLKTINAISLGVAAVLLYTAPTFVMLLSLLLFHEKLSVRKMLMLGMTFFGCLLVTGMLESGGVAVTPTGILLGLCSGLCYALYSIFGTYAIKRGYSSFTITFYTFVAAAFFMVFLVKPVALVERISNQHLWLYSVVYAVVTTTFPYLAYTKGLSYIKASNASVIATVEPVVAALLGIFVFQESASFMKILGITLVLGSVFLTGEKKSKIENKGEKANLNESEGL